MALNKNIIDERGISSNYHKIGYISLANGALTCSLDSYVSSEYRDAEKEVSSNFFNFHITLKEEESMGIRQLAYTKIKELPEWQDAIDC